MSSDESPAVGLGEEVYLVDGQEMTEVTASEFCLPDGEEDLSTGSAAEDEQQLEIDEDENEGAIVSDMSTFTFSGHTDCVYSVAINPIRKDTIITGGGDDMAYIWKFVQQKVSAEPLMEMDVESCTTTHGKEEVIPLTGHTDTVTAVGFNFNGDLALTGSYDGTVRIWRTETGEQVQILEGPEDVEWAHWHGRGNAVIAGSRDGTVWMWLTHNGQCVQVFAGHDGAVSAGCFSTDGKLVCSGGEDGSVRVWLPKSGACKHVFSGHAGHEAMVTCLASSDSGDMLLSGSADGTMRLYLLSGKKLLRTFVHNQLDSNSAAAAAATTAAASQQSTVFRVEKGARAVGSFAGATVATIREREGEDGGEGEDEGDEEQIDLAEEGLTALAVESVGFSRDSFKWAASGGMDKMMRIWDLDTGGCRSVCMHAGSVVALQWHSSLPVVCTAALDNLLRIWDARSGSVLQELSGHTDLVTNFVLLSSPSTPDAVSVAEGDEDLIATVSDDHTSKVFTVSIASLLR